MLEASIQIATAVIGPQSGGRGYRVLARGGAVEISPSADGRITEFALALAGWADEREPSAAALIPLDEDGGGWMLLRAAYLGAMPTGTVAFANCLILDSRCMHAIGGHAENLLPFIPLPDGSRDFAEEPTIVSLAPSPPAPRHDWTGLGLEWRDRIVVVPAAADVEPTLRSILGDITPIGPDSRILGWSTTALLPSAGGFSAPRAFQLIVVNAAQGRPQGLPHLVATATQGRFEGERVELSPPALAWERFRSLGAGDAALERSLRSLRWSPAYFDLAPAELLRGLAATVIGTVDGASQMRLIGSMTESRHDSLDSDFAYAARATFASLLDSTGLKPQHSAYYVKALVEGSDSLIEAMAPVGPLLIRAGSAQWLQGRTFEAMLRLRYAETIADLEDDPAPFLDGFSDQDFARLLYYLEAHVRETPALSALLEAVLTVLADSLAQGDKPAWADAFGLGLGMLLDSPTALPLRRLASHNIVACATRFAPERRTKLAARALRLAPAERPLEAAELVRTLRGGLEWVRLAGASQ